MDNHVLLRHYHQFFCHTIKYHAHVYTVPPPTLTVSRDPDASTTLRHGDSLSLTCTIQLDEAVDSDVVVIGRLQGQAGMSSNVVARSGTVYEIVLYIPSLRATPSETCICTATVGPGPGVEFIQSSELQTNSLNIIVGN